ncbi:AraC family transcriptional regulator [Moheibacter sediminis]|uniref:AraC-type DNA-binding protein n=1 Tax=Moheibacter sediminis TaxID=1434700 RepID=A0A1W2B6W7_9FLAO|nr:helix-turn-helix domain-containing protein [Moheibacter sediminis]SMC68098.1 AraC-type DNA-binding protein [Moheibacter sediminis]
MTDHAYPTFDIVNLIADKIPNEMLNIDRFEGYLVSNPHLNSVHGHHYYHVAFFTKGKGNHLIDFEYFPIENGTIYFMNPSQVHQWFFDSEIEGYVINFSDTFFDWLSIHSNILQQFPFFNSPKLKNQTFQLDKISVEKITSIFEEMLDEMKEEKTYSNLILALKLLEIFALTGRYFPTKIEIPEKQKQNSITLKKFQNLIEENFKNIRLPKYYAELLHITPNHLNVICKELTGISAGEFIRNRIILEAKRLLINFDLSVSEIAYNLNFQDTSYFVKFFKKSTQITPEVFRKKFYK